MTRMSKALTRFRQSLGMSTASEKPLPRNSAGYLERGWVIANHKLVSFHAAFLSSILNLPTKELNEAIVGGANAKFEVLKFMFSPANMEVWISLVILYLSWHIAIAIHEMGHFLTAVNLTALNKDSQDRAETEMQGNKALWYAGMLVKIPWGKFYGVKKEEGNYAPDAPYNLAVAAAAPVWSQKLAMLCLPIAGILIALGLAIHNEALIYIGRFFLAPGFVGLLDRFEADRGKLKEFRTRESQAAEQAARAAAKATGEDWFNKATEVKAKLLAGRMMEVNLNNGSKVRSPWQYRNCAMGGCHTEKEYPESNISMQEGMFMPLSAHTYEESQEMVVNLQSRLKQIIESAPGAKVMGIGLEGGLAPYIDKEDGDKVPEQRMWRMMKQAILDCEYVPGVDVAIALDPAASELENAYRNETGQKDATGMYRFWRDKSKLDMSRDDIQKLYEEAMHDGVPILSIEDGFGELDHAGWNLIMDRLGDKVFVVGDDLVTTKDTNIEKCAKNGEINSTLIKANQIGTLSETVLAMLTSLAYDAELIVSHRSKSPNDPFEAEISTAMNAFGLKAGGGANTERLQKYGRVIEILTIAEKSNRKMTADERKNVEQSIKDIAAVLTGQKDVSIAKNAADIDVAALVMSMLAIEAVAGNEEPTNAGIPTAAATLFLGRSGAIRFKGSTPLGTSAGVDEAIHFVDSMIMPCDLTKKYADMFNKADDGTFSFKKELKFDDVKAKGDDALLERWRVSRRYQGKGCMEAVKNLEETLSKTFVGKKLSELGSLLNIDQILLQAEWDQAVALGMADKAANAEKKVAVMQRKGVLGMNAILSLSVAMGRAVAAAQGKEMWQLIREVAAEAMAKFIGAHSPEKKSKKDIEKLLAGDFDELQTAFREVAREVRKDNDIAPLLRKQLPVYPV
jgi:enolase